MTAEEWIFVIAFLACVYIMFSKLYMLLTRFEGFSVQKSLFEFISFIFAWGLTLSLSLLNVTDLFYVLLLNFNNLMLGLMSMFFVIEFIMKVGDYRQYFKEGFTIKKEKKVMQQDSQM